ncbi:hypothetical protein ABBQ38_015293 [Trebouxia sp. C0009 RCD-2024]
MPTKMYYFRQSSFAVLSVLLCDTTALRQKLQQDRLMFVWFPETTEHQGNPMQQGRYGSNAPQRACLVPEEELHRFAEVHVKYSLVYKGAYEAADSSNYDVWTSRADWSRSVKTGIREINC